MAFPRLTIAVKLYAIFALLATVTLVLAVVAVANARRHSALTDAFRASFDGARQIERVNALIYAVVMESRGLAHAPDVAAARPIAVRLIAGNDRLGDAVTELQWDVRPEDNAQFEASAPGSKIYFTPEPLFEAVTTQWAATLQQMVAKEVPVDEGLDMLAASIDEQLKQAGLG